LHYQGKSSILLRFIDDKFLGEDVHEATIGVDFKAKKMNIDGQEVSLTLWDTAGQERFRTLTSSYYRGAQGVILLYDVTHAKSFENLDSWFKEVETYCSSGNVVKIVVGNKIDKSDRVVLKEEGQQYAKDMSALFIECSAKSKIGIDQAFEEMVRKIIETPVHALKSGGLKVESAVDSEGSGCYC
jgi:Ras-related protein Rab-18